MDYNWLVNKEITRMFLSMQLYWLGEKPKTKTKEVGKKTDVSVRGDKLLDLVNVIR